MPLPICTSGQLPYLSGTVGTGGALGTSPADACQATATWHNVNGYGPSVVVSNTDAVCNFTASGGYPLTYSIVQVCEPSAPDPDPPPPGDVSAVQIQAVNGYVTLTYVVGTQTVVVEPPPLTEEKLADLMEAGGFLMLALLVVFCSRALLDLLRTDSIKD